MSRPIKYIATVSPVQEVGLAGTADPEYWAEHLSSEDLHPTVVAGHAQVQLGAVAYRWKGLVCREFVFGLWTTRHQGGTGRDGFYLIAGFHSRPILAWIERTLFKAPYRQGAISLRAEPPCAAEAPGIRAAMRQARPPAAERDDDWEGPIHLPTAVGLRHRQHKCFYAHLSGHLLISPFDPRHDVLKLVPDAEHPVYRWLLDGQFKPVEWRCGTTGTHKRAKTHVRDVTSDKAD